MPKITAEKLNAELDKGTFAPIYLLTGEDTYRKNLVIEKIKSALNPDDFNFYKSEADKADISEALAQANTAPVFSNARVIILTGIEKLRKEPKEALLRYIENPLPTTTLILTYNDSKKMKTEKALAGTCTDNGRVVNFEELKADSLAAWVRSQLLAKGLTPTFESVDLLCESVGSELTALENEIEKIALYTLDRQDKTVTEKDVLNCIGFSKEQNPYELANLITACNKNEALNLLDKLVDDGEEPIAILSKMTYPILKMARIKRLSAAGMSAPDILHTAGLFPWESRLISASRKFPSIKNFEQALNRIIEADSNFKSSTVSDPKVTLKGILFTLFR